MGNWKRAEVRLIGFFRYLTTLGRTTKSALLLFSDAALCIVAVWIAFSLRLGAWQLSGAPVLIVIVISLAIWWPVALLRGTYRTIVRYFGARTTINITVSCIALGTISSVIYVLLSIDNVPRTIGAIHAIVFAALLMMSRMVAGYLLFDLPQHHEFEGKVSRVLIYGAGSAGRQLGSSLRLEPGMLLRGYIDDDRRMAGHQIDGTPVFSADNPAELVESLEITTVLLAVPNIPRQRREAIVRSFADLKVRVLILPAVGEFLSGSASLADLREVEIDDLLGRSSVAPDEELLRRSITGQSVMVTGAGGSIGSELCRQIFALGPVKLVMVDMTEHALYSIERELLELSKKDQAADRPQLHADLTNIADPAAVGRLMSRWRPATVFHAAAYKHVPLIEDNVISGMRNNIFGTLNCVTEALRHGIERFILVSTDKAVRPTNVMGATKRVCELILQASSAEDPVTTFAMVRFGNVLGSSGSVVPMFKRQIRAGGPVTLTHLDINRFFMTIPEASQLVIQAGSMARGGEVFVLDMGEPVRIYDLARTMINLSGLSVRDAENPEGDIEISVVGLRKGEKLYEELLIGNSPRETTHPRIMQATEPFISWTELKSELALLDEALASGDTAGALKILSVLVPEFDHKPLQAAILPAERQN